MTYADKLLADGERVVLRRRQHWMSLVRDSIRGWLLWLLAIVLLAIVPIFNLASNVANVSALVAIVVFGGGLAHRPLAVPVVADRGIPGHQPPPDQGQRRGEQEVG